MNCDELIERIEDALLNNNGEQLEEAWYALYAQHPAKAVQIARVMSPLVQREVVVA